MKLLLKLTLLLVCMGCTTIKVTEMTTAQKVQHFKEEFYKNFRYAVQLDIKLERSIFPFLHGRCLPDVPVAILNPYSIKNMTDGQLQHLVTHELAHCGLDIEHNPDNVTMRAGGETPFPLEYTIQHTIALRQVHQDTCDGKLIGIRKLAFNDTKTHHSCFNRISISEGRWFGGK